MNQRCGLPNQSNCEPVSHRTNQAASQPTDQWVQSIKSPNHSNRPTAISVDRSATGPSTSQRTRHSPAYPKKRMAATATAKAERSAESLAGRLWDTYLDRMFFCHPRRRRRTGHTRGSGGCAASRTLKTTPPLGNYGNGITKRGNLRSEASQILRVNLTSANITQL